MTSKFEQNLPDIDASVVRTVLAAAGLDRFKWNIQAVSRGRNSQVFRATNERGTSYAVKFPPKDERRRCQWEMNILTALPPDADLAPCVFR